MSQGWRQILGLRLGRPMRWALGLALLVGLLAQMPAFLADQVLSQASGGVLRLADAQGSLWSGSAQVQVYPARLGREDGQEAAAGAPTEAVSVLPGRLDWQIGWTLWGDRAIGLAPFSGTVMLRHPSLSGSIQSRPLAWNVSGWFLPAGQLTLPQLDLRESGAGLVLFRPIITPRVRWTDLMLTASGLSPAASALAAERSTITLDLQNVSSSLSPIQPLGSYRFELSLPDQPAGAAPAMSQGLGWALSTPEDVPLVLRGQGRLDPRSAALLGQLEMRCSRSCEFIEGLMATIGKKNGDLYEAKLGL